MRKTLTYKGYSGSIEVSIKDNCLHGSLLFIDDKVTYEGDTPKELEENFKEAINGYIEFCKEIGDEPQTPYKGSLNVRIGPELHKQIAVRSYRDEVSINHFIKEAVAEKLASHDPQVVTLVHEHRHKVVVDEGSYSAVSTHTFQQFGEDIWEPKPVSAPTSH